MKNFKKYQLILSFFMVCSSLSATDWNKTNRNFRYDKDVDPNMSIDYTRSMTTVSYHDTLYNFVNYRSSGYYHGKIVQRKIHHSGDMPAFKWHIDKDSDIEHINKVDAEDWQPAAVVFRDSLLLFVSSYEDESVFENGFLSYSVYNPLHGKWSALIAVNGGDYYGGATSHGAAAVVLDDKLCVITHDHDENVMIRWTKDLKTWHHFMTNVNIDNSSGENDQLSAVTTTFTLDSKKRSKLVFAWLNSSKHPYTCEYYFSNDSTLTYLRTIKISTDDEYSSVALAVGTISCPQGSPSDCVPDLTSSGECVQAFLKRDSQDNSHKYHRIKRFQLLESDPVWRKIENNLVPQNSPNHYWASREIPLTAAILTVPDGNKGVRQFMCLVYRGFDNLEYPMNVAWAETNKLVYNSAQTKYQELNTPEYKQYIGYIEGPPPYHVNRPSMNHPLDPYVNHLEDPISNLEVSTTSGQTNTNELGFDVKYTTKAKMGWLEANLSSAFGKAWTTEYTTKVTHTTNCEAKSEPKGKYIVLCPNVSRIHYDVMDVQNKVFDTAYYFLMTPPSYHEELAELADGLDPGNPETYTFAERAIEFGQWYPTAYDHDDNSWAGDEATVILEVDDESTVTYTTNAKVAVGIESEFGEFFNVGFEIESSFDWKMETKTSKENEVKFVCALNEALDSTDVTSLDYSVYWIKPNHTGGVVNWWLPEGTENQNTWCITYQVTRIVYNNGDTVTSLPPEWAGINQEETQSDQSDQGETGNQPGNTEAGQESSNGFSLSQNYPDPFIGNTKIKYQIGNSDSQNESGGQGIATRLLVFNITGNLVATLVNEAKEPGNYEVNWNASNLQPGMYYYSLQSGTYRNVKKLIIMK